MSNLYDLFPNLKSTQEEADTKTPPLDIKPSEAAMMFDKIDSANAKYDSKKTLSGTGNIQDT
jgi:hypothetical protein